MIITDPEMQKKMSRTLALSGNVHTLDDIDAALRSGNMQGHVFGDTWALTEIQQFPRKKVVNIVYAVGNLSDAIELEPRITEWSVKQGAHMMTAVGRYGWFKFATPGWKEVGASYLKEL